MEVVNSSFAAYIDMFTPNTYVMVILSDPTIRKYLQLFIRLGVDFILFLVIASAATLINIRNARKHFEKLENQSQQGQLLAGRP